MDPERASPPRRPAIGWYLVDGAPVLLDEELGPLDPAGRRVDPCVWMERGVPVSEEVFLAALHRGRPPAGT